MSLRRFFGPLNACPHYPWTRHLLMLVPMLALLLAMGLQWSWWGDPVRALHEAAASAHPRVTVFMRLLSAWGSIPLYLVYLGLLIHGLSMRDPRRPDGDGGAHPDVMLVRRCVLFSLLLTLAATQFLKYGLGMPRPLAAWPPAPFSFDFLYNSFPSGHTTEITASAIPLGLRFRRFWIYAALALLIVLVGYSRIWLSRHHPVDLVGGLIMGSLIARLIMYCHGAPRA